jgi:thiopurine S-methyltransferase
VELVPTAIHQFFVQNGIPYQQVAPHRYEAERLTMLNMDFFDVTTSDIGEIDFIYDRAALVALPAEMRMRYIQKIDQLVAVGSEQLVITLEYAPLLDTPPFSITPTEIAAYYGTRHAIEHIEAPTLPGHRMVEKFNLAYLKEHGFWLRRRA